MAPLPTDLRKLLEKVIIKARQSAEAGAKNALEMLAVDRHEPHTSMSPEERALRNRLRARGRQLGDIRDKARGTQSIDRLVQEVAYEYWHRMLFARLLTENHLLIEPSSDVAISMEECEELAREAGEDPRTMASRFAQGSLPQIFRSGDPVLEVTLAPESRKALDKQLDSLPTAVFTADDSLGWTYQFWQSENKDAANAAGNKIGADELPAVTQLFTEHYMVLFLYHNTIGAWHAGKVLAANPGLAETALSEDDLRQVVRLRSKGGYDFEYLRFVREVVEGDEEDAPTGPWRPAAGTFEGWPKTAAEMKILDPCCGSGHFLTEGVELLVRLRMDEEDLDLEGAVADVLASNLHGLELDPRCTQIAAFNLALAAWKMVGRPIELPQLNVACTGLAVGSTKAEWSKLAGNNESLRNGMDRLYGLFEQAPELGSLIDPKAVKGDMYEAGFSELQPLLEQALDRESEDAEEIERAVAAKGMARAAQLLSDEYTLAITNVPYLGRNDFAKDLALYTSSAFPEAKSNLATCFLQRCFDLCKRRGTVATVSPQSWLFLGPYRRFREQLLTKREITFVAQLGKRAFETITGEVVNVNLSGISASANPRAKDVAMIDVTNHPDAAQKASSLFGADIHRSSQVDLLKNPDHRISTIARDQVTLLRDFAKSYKGVATGDLERFIRSFWEVRSLDVTWRPLQVRPHSGSLCGGMSKAILWESGKGQLYRFVAARLGKNGVGAWLRGEEAWNSAGVAIGQMTSLPCSLYFGELFDENTAAIIPHNAEYLPAIWQFCQSEEYQELVRQSDNSSLKIPNLTLIKVPFNLDQWRGIAAEKYPNGLPEPQSDDPTQWLFHGHPANAHSATILQVAVGRLLGYRWPPELDPEMRLTDDAREWVARCDALKQFADDDGIVCLSATRGERSAAERLRELLSAAFGPSWSPAKERELLTVAGDGKKPSASLEVWLRDKFFEEHCKLFLNRPFVWHIWDGNKDGFHCLVNGHKLTGPNGEGRRTLEAITYSYLGDWIDRQKADQTEGKEGADARLAAAQDLQGQLVKILEGEPPYDLFVRWKPLHGQAIGWEPDINDGVRLNARPFMNAKLSKCGKKGAGILRWKPNIKWQKDRGNEPLSLRPKTDFPWFWDCEGGAVDFVGGKDFDGNRWNDLQYTRAEKERARDRGEAKR